MADLVIRGGNVVDGTGKPGILADVVIDGSSIVGVGLGSTIKGDREIDARGMVVTPGFVDIHTHFDGQATWDSQLSPSSDYGVTSIVMGNCGVGFAPAAPEARNALIELLEGVEDIPGTALHEGITWDWETFPQYMDALERRPFSIDVAAMIGHSPLRLYAMGLRGRDPDEIPTAAEVEAMGDHVRRSVEAGAIGFATSRTVAHKTKSGDPIGTLRAGDAELLGIARHLRGTNGVIQLASDAYQSEDESHLWSELRLVESLARISERPVSMSLMQPEWAPDRWRVVLNEFARLNEEGLDVRAQVAPRPIGIIEGLETTLNPFSACSSYQEIADLPLAERLISLHQSDRRKRILFEHQDLSERTDRFRNAVFTNFHKLFPVQDPVQYEPDPENSLASVAERSGRTGAEVAYDVLLENNGHQLLYMPILNWARQNLDDVREMLLSPYTVVGLSDAGAHCGQICDASFPISLLSHWVRDRAEGNRLPLPFVVHQLTQRTATQVGWRDRGVVAPGYLADINVLDIDNLRLHPPRMVSDLPGGGGRLLQDVTGVVATVKRGQVIVENGRHTGQLPGRLVRGTQRDPS